MWVQVGVEVFLAFPLLEAHFGWSRAKKKPATALVIGTIGMSSHARF